MLCRFEMLFTSKTMSTHCVEVSINRMSTFLLPRYKTVPSVAHSQLFNRNVKLKIASTEKIVSIHRAVRICKVNLSPFSDYNVYCRAVVNITDNSCTKQANLSIFGPKIKSCFKSRAGYNGARTVHVSL